MEVKLESCFYFIVVEWRHRVCRLLTHLADEVACANHVEMVTAKYEPGPQARKTNVT